MEKIENYVGAAKIKECLVQVTDIQYTCNYIKPIKNFNLQFLILCVKTKPLYSACIENLFCFQIVC